MKIPQFLMLNAIILLLPSASFAQSTIDLSSGSPSQTQGWVLLTDETASHLSNTNQYQYLYLRGNRYYLSQSSNLVWGWSQGQQLIGGYTYFDGASTGSIYCGGSGEIPAVGVGCSSGPGNTPKVYPTDPANPTVGQATICQDTPDIFQVGACGLATIYVQGANTHPPIIAISGISDGAIYAQGSNVSVSYACTDSGGGVASCTGSVPSGTAINTAQLGAYTLKVTSTDAAGDFNVKIVQYSVVPQAWGQGWVLLTDQIASGLTGSSKQYLYLYNGRWYVSPPTSLVWSWTQGQQLTGTYGYFDGTTIGAINCAGSSELPMLGVGCSNGGGVKVLATLPAYAVIGEVTVCQDVPDIFQVGSCAPARVYVRSNVGMPPVITIAAPADGATYAQGGTVLAAYGCSDVLSQIATCNGTVNSGAAIDTSQLGTYTVTVTATDTNGNFNWRVVKYGVVPSQEQGSVLLNDQTASQLTANAIKRYFYLAVPGGGECSYFGACSAAGAWYLSPPTTLVWNWTQGQQLPGTYQYFDGTNIGSIYCGGSDEQPQWGVGCSSGGGGTPKVLTIYDNDSGAGQGTVCQDIPDAFGVGACGWATFFVWQAPQQASATTATGSNVAVEDGAATLTFSSVSTSGTTTVQQIDPGTVGQVPSGYAVSNIVAYQITTTATFSSSVTIGLLIPGPISQADFNNLRILHNDDGNLVDITSRYDYANLTIYGTTNSFSPFYLARVGPHIVPVFNQTAAYKSGSTIPIKLQVLDAANVNISSSSLVVQARGLLWLKEGTELNVADSGNSNPDYDFRYDSSIGSTGGYIFNLSTKGLVSGTYSLSMYVGGDKQYAYNVTFQVR